MSKSQLTKIALDEDIYIDKSWEKEDIINEFIKYGMLKKENQPIKIAGDIRIPNYISGPVSFIYYRVKNTDILLFGDIHYDTKTMCNNCTILDQTTDEPVLGEINEDCYTLSAWIKNILDQLKDSSEYLDLYIEDEFKFLQSRKDGIIKKSKAYPYDGRHFELRRVYRNCNSCNNLRYHLLDTRFFTTDSNNVHNMITTVNTALVLTINNLYNLKYPADDVWNELSLYFKELIEVYKEYSLLCAVSTNYPEDLDNFISQKRDVFLDIFENLYEEVLNDLLETKNLTKNYRNMKLHPIAKQFRKLMEQEHVLEIPESEINATIEKMAKYIIDITKYEDRITDENMLKLKNIWDEAVNEIQFMNLEDKTRTVKEKVMPEMLENLLFARITYLMDLYAIPRILYNYPNSKLKIYSAGDYHIFVLQNFLEEFYPGSLIKEVTYEEGQINRCLNIFL